MSYCPSHLMENSRFASRKKIVTQVDCRQIGRDLPPTFFYSLAYGFDDIQIYMRFIFCLYACF
jgi:hypothetical protein